MTPCLNEWNYGDYEGLTLGDIARIREQTGQGAGSNWNIWTDGCPNGEYVLLFLLSRSGVLLAGFSVLIWLTDGQVTRRSKQSSRRVDP